MVIPAVRRLKQSPPGNWNFSSNVMQQVGKGLVPVRGETLFCLSSHEELEIGGQAWLFEPSRTQAFDPKHSSNKTAGFVSHQPLTQQMHRINRPLAR